MGLVMTPRLGATPRLDTPGFFGGDSGISYEELQARKRIAQELMRGNGQIRTVGEGINSAAGSIAGALMKRRANKEEGKQRDAAIAAFDSFIPNFFGGSAPLTGTASTKNAPAGNYADAIASVESAGSGDYSAVGPNTPKGRAYGRYQVMDFNIGPWTEKYLGRRMTPQEFLADPAAQDAVFNGEFGGYVQKYGNPQDAASMWFSGRPMAEAGNASDGYTTVPEYVAKFSGALGEPRMSSQGIQTAQAGGIDPTIIQQLAQLAGSPYLGPGRKAIVGALLQQQLQAMQPPQKRDTQWVPNVGLIDTQTGEIISAAPTGSGTDQTEYGVTPQYIVREDGSLGMVVLGTDGTAKEVELPEGAAIQKGVEKLDLGTSYQWYNTLTGEEIGQPIPKDIAEAEAEKARGKAEGEAYVANRAELPKVEAQATEAINLIDSIMNDPALASITGNIQGNLPAGIPFVTGGQAGANLMPKIRQLQGQVFLQAYESLRGAQAITDVEGRKATEAKARLDRAQDEKTYREALMELRDIVQTGLARARAKAGVSEPAAAQQAAPSDMPQVGDVVDGYRFNGGAPWDEKNWEPVQ